MIYLIGEWPLATTAIILTFGVAGAGVFALGWWVMRGDRANRALQAAETSPDDHDQAAAHEQSA